VKLLNGFPYTTWTAMENKFVEKLLVDGVLNG
jgi:hypothetical protein